MYALDGIEGVAKQARSWKESQPYGYLFWLGCLKNENRLDDIVDAAREALQSLQKGKDRQKVSLFLIEAGQLMGNEGVVLEGKLENFFSNACDDNLIDLHKEGVNQGKRDETLKAVLDFFAKQKKMENDEKSLYLKTLLMAGEMDKAFAMVKNAKSIGWSYGFNAGLFFGAAAFAIVDSTEVKDCPAIRNLLSHYAEKSSVYSYEIIVKEQDDITFYDEIIKGIRNAEISTGKREQYFDRLLKTGSGRIDHIVSNQHRRAYGRAAQVLGVIAEIYAAKGDVKKAVRVVDGYCKDKYNRHSAFRREMRGVIQGSNLLNNAGVSG